MPNSGHYLLLMWSRLVSSQTYLKTDMATLLDSLTPRVLEAYINFRLESVQVFQEGDLEEGILSFLFLGHDSRVQNSTAGVA